MLQFSAVSLLVAGCFAWSPTDSYAPGIVDCPSYLDESNYTSDSQQGFLRIARNLSSSESTWMDARDEITNENLRWFLNLADMTDFDTDDFMDTLSDEAATNASVRATPRIGLAFSGGGYRAMINAGGQLAGLDNRTTGAEDYGVPILQATSFIAGLSGGSWFVSTLAFNNWTSVQEIVDGTSAENHTWNLENNILIPWGLKHPVMDLEYWEQISDQVSAKKDAGFELSLTDPWGRGLSHQFFPNLPDFGASMTFTSLRDFDCFKNQEMPFPLIVANGRVPGTTIINENSTIFEFNPFEMGSWDPSLYSFVDLKYVGTDMDGGQPSSDNGSCIAGLDNAGYVFGTSSTLFNEVLLELNTTGLTGTLYTYAQELLGKLSGDDDDIAEWTPNPFYNTPWGNSDSIKQNDSLYLVDGGEDYQNIPLYPLLQAERAVDIIFAYDNSYDTDDKWPNGTSLVYSYERQFSSQVNGTAFPYVPDQATFLNLNLTARPTFFGCYADNLTDLMEEVGAVAVPPLIVYMANRPYSYNSNTSTYKMSYDTDVMLSMIQNGFEVSTRDNLTVDDDFRACVGCAILQRSRERLGLAMGDQCKSCFDNYCWDGTIDSSEEDLPNAFTDDGLYYDDGSSSSTESSEGPSATGSSSGSGSGGGGGSKNAAPALSIPKSAYAVVLAALMIVV